MTNQPFPVEALVRGLDKHISDAIQEETAKIIDGCQDQLRAAVRARLSKLLPSIRTALHRHAYDQEVFVNIRLDGELISPMPPQDPKP